MEQIAPDRRSIRVSDDAGPVELVEAHLGAAERQLATARERLISARRRVVALEEAVANWTELARAARSAPARRR
jgi:hypothetical protein